MAKRIRKPKTDSVINEEIETVQEETVQEEPTIEDFAEDIVEEVLDPNPVYKWKKLGGGALRFPNRIIKPGQLFSAREDEIPKSFLNSLQKIGLSDEVSVTTKPVKEVQKVAVEVKPVDPQFSIHHRSGQWYDIVDKEGKRLNEKALQKEEAERLLKQLL